MRRILKVVCEQEMRFSLIIEDGVVQFLIKEPVGQIEGDFIIVHVL